MVVLPVIVLAVVLSEMESHVIVIGPEPEAIVLPAPAVSVKVPAFPVPAVKVIAELEAAVVNISLTVILPPAPPLRITTGSLKVVVPELGFTVTKAVPSERPIVIEEKVPPLFM
jgi:hypothetical protein